MYNPTEANEDQLDKLYKKHISKPCFCLNYSYDSEDQVGFFSFVTLTGKRIEGQLRRDEPYFVEVTGFGDTRYDINYPKAHYKLYKRLKYLALKARTRFLRGSQI